MHVAGNRTDLRVGVPGQRLLDKIHEPGLALERGQERDGVAAQRRFCGGGCLAGGGKGPAAFCTLPNN